MKKLLVFTILLGLVAITYGRNLNRISDASKQSAQIDANFVDIDQNKASKLELQNAIVSTYTVVGIYITTNTFNTTNNMNTYVSSNTYTTVVTYTTATYYTAGMWEIVDGRIIPVLNVVSDTLWEVLGGRLFPRN